MALSIDLEGSFEASVESQDYEWTNGAVLRKHQDEVQIKYIYKGTVWEQQVLVD